jgi:hypothetical protein
MGDGVQAALRPFTVRTCAWALLAVWLAATAVVFRSVPVPIRPSNGPLAVAFALAAAGGVGVVVFFHVKPTHPRILALIAALVVTLVQTSRDLQWLQGGGRNDGQAGLVWLDPSVVLLIAFPVALVVTAGARSALARLRHR